MCNKYRGINSLNYSCKLIINNKIAEKGITIIRPLIEKAENTIQKHTGFADNEKAFDLVNGSTCGILWKRKATLDI